MLIKSGSRTRDIIVTGYSFLTMAMLWCFGLNTMVTRCSGLIVIMCSSLIATVMMGHCSLIMTIEQINIRVGNILQINKIQTCNTCNTTNPSLKRKSPLHPRLLYDSEDMHQALTQKTFTQWDPDYHLSSVMSEWLKHRGGPQDIEPNPSYNALQLVDQEMGLLYYH